jgi:hypothetical protein
MTRLRSRKAAVASWTAQVVAAAILGQTLLFKFTGAPESRAIFEALGAEPWGRWASGAAELLAVVLLLVPRTAALGAALSLGVMAGAIGAHLTKLGIEVQGDGGTLFALALVTTAASATVAWLRRADLPLLGTARAERANG